MTFLPLKSDRESLPPPLVVAVNSGALSPSFNFSSGEPKWNGFQILPMLKTQDHNARNEQQFVRQRIENRPEFAALVVAPRNVAVHPIANRRDRKSQDRQ